MKRILSIAASDSGGGAGIQADLKTITLLGEFGMTAITAVTSQNTLRIKTVYALPPKFVEEQIESVITDIGVDAVKTGMLVNSEIVEAVSRLLKKYQIEKVVVDPVIRAKGGEILLSEEGQKTLIHKLFPLSFLVTPNLFEASLLLGRKLESLEDMKKAAQTLWKMGAKNVLIKGGHLKEDPIDILYNGKDIFEFSFKRIDTPNTHGTGCTFATAIAVELAKGKPIEEAIRNSKRFIASALRHSLSLGKGVGPLNPYAAISREIEVNLAICEIKEALEILKREKIGHLIPEVQSNLVYALSGAKGLGDVVSIPGRIIRLKDSVATLSEPEPGASFHMANLILAIMRHNPEYRACINIRYLPQIVKRYEELGFKVCFADRQKEPEEIKKIEGKSLEWVIERIMVEEKVVPDVIWDEGDWGKEPMIRVIGKTPKEVVQKILTISK